MGLLSYDAFHRTAVLACDACDRVLQNDGSLSDKTKRDCSPDDLAPHFRPADDLPIAALAAGWQVVSAQGGERARWTCPACRFPAVEPMSRARRRPRSADDE